MLQPLVILLNGAAVVIGAILVLRSYAFLALILAALVVAFCSLGEPPVVVLYEAVALAEIAQTWPHVPFLTGLTHEQRDRVAGAAKRVASQGD